MNQKRDVRYNVINMIVLIITVLSYVRLCGANIRNIVSRFTTGYYICIVLTVICVQLIKCIRLYFMIAGKGMTFEQHMKQYCKCIPVSMVLPFKTGEVFRAYCYGYQMKKYARGIIIVILERFVDTFALVTVSLLFRIVLPYRLTHIECILIIFLLGMIICYIIFPGLYRYWNNYLICARTKKRNIVFLHGLEVVNNFYLEISSVCKQRFSILYVLSVVAWFIEVGGLIICNRIAGEGYGSEVISSYLMSSLTGTSHAFLVQFIFISVLLLLTLYIIRKIWIMVISKGDKNTNE